MNSKVVLVTGMHRSGTSVTAQWLYRCGLFIGERLLGPGTGNDDGHFEDADFLELHQQLLRNRQLPDTGLTPEPVPGLSLTEQEELGRFIVHKQEGHNQWGWKEPRTSLFLNDYSQLLPEAYYFVVVRNFNDTVNSLVTREYKMQEEKISRKKGLSKLKWKYFKRKTMEQLLQQQAKGFLKTWISYYEQILFHISLVPPERLVVISCPQLLHRDKAVFTKLTQQWGLDLHYFSFNHIFKQHYISKPHTVDGFIKDKTLVAKARSIEEQLQMKYGIGL
ncbi:MAG: hypothetical protein U0V75_15860 [Ferruginibacter sp.]